ncbi:MAG: hypothetical protein PHW49_08375, partial [Acinetobacter harbinensis]|nr:hypothetical protein [Acinetobacter harbinensis]
MLKQNYAELRDNPYTEPNRKDLKFQVFFIPSSIIVVQRCSRQNLGFDRVMSWSTDRLRTVQ